MSQPVRSMLRSTPVRGMGSSVIQTPGCIAAAFARALAPFPSPKYVVAVTDEAGGFGADTAAPMARTILAKLFGVRGDKGHKGGPSD